MKVRECLRDRPVRTDGAQPVPGSKRASHYGVRAKDYCGAFVHLEKPMRRTKAQLVARPTQDGHGLAALRQKQGAPESETEKSGRVNEFTGHSCFAWGDSAAKK